MKIFLLLILISLTTLISTAQTPTDLFFSEYIEGTGNNKALEIYNPTNRSISLANYFVLRYSNGASTYSEGGITRLSGTIAAYKTFVLVNGQVTSTPTSPACSPVLQAMANQLDGEYPAPTYMNGNDVLALIKTTDGNVPNASFTNVIPVDLFGQIGLGAAISAETGWSPVKDSTLSYKNSGGDVITGKVINYIVQAKSATVNGVSSNAQFGPFWMSWTSDHTLIRKVSIVKGVTTSPIPFKVNMEWDTAHAVLDSAGHWNYKDIWTNLGKHDCRADPFLSVDKSSPAAGVSIYPNPVTDGHFTISSQTAVKEIEIFSILGQSVHRQTAKKGQQQQIEIGPVKLEKGLYMVRVTSSSNVTTVKKIIVR